MTNKLVYVLGTAAVNGNAAIAHRRSNGEALGRQETAGISEEALKSSN
jgi:hypothetical protein